MDKATCSEVAKKGWAEQRQLVHEFLKTPRWCGSQHASIEWSSSEDEVEVTKCATVAAKTVKKHCPKMGRSGVRPITMKNLSHQELRIKTHVHTVILETPEKQFKSLAEESSFESLAEENLPKHSGNIFVPILNVSKQCKQPMNRNEHCTLAVEINCGRVSPIIGSRQSHSPISREVIGSHDMAGKTNEIHKPGAKFRCTAEQKSSLPLHASMNYKHKPTGSAEVNIVEHHSSVTDCESEVVDDKKNSMDSYLKPKLSEPVDPSPVVDILKELPHSPIIKRMMKSHRINYQSVMSDVDLRTKLDKIGVTDEMQIYNQNASYYDLTVGSTDCQDQLLDQHAKPVRLTQDISDSTEPSNPYIDSQLSQVFEMSSSSDRVNMRDCEILKTGSVWLKELQRKTPSDSKKLNTKEAFVESTRKKVCKDGHAARLRRLIQSWRSDVHIWQHQMVTLSRQPGNLDVVDVTNVVKTSVDELEKNASVRKIIPVRRSLMEVLISTPSPPPLVTTCSLKEKFGIGISNKFMTVKLVKVGGPKLPPFAAECQRIGGTEHVREEVGAPADGGGCVVFFAIQHQDNVVTFRVGDIVNIYLPWQRLDLPDQLMPVIFCSFFIIEKKINELTMNEDRKPEINLVTETVETKRLIPTDWRCPCAIDSGQTGGHCAGGPLGCMSLGLAGEQSSSIRYWHGIPDFHVVSQVDNLKQERSDKAWTILEAIEKCRGISDVPVSVTVRLHQVLPHIESGHIVTSYTLIGQDAMGSFCVIQIPNRPLAQCLRGILDGGRGGTYSFTHLSVVSRLTNSQNVGLFSMLSSLHRVYQNSVTLSELDLIQRDLASRPFPNYCYSFSVTLGVTEASQVKMILEVDLILPQWSLMEAAQIPLEGERGNLSLVILYKIDSRIYVVDSLEENQKEENAIKTEIGETGKGSTPENKGFVTYVTVSSGTAVPDWLSTDGTVMQKVIVSSAVVWHGQICIDEFSVLQKCKCEVSFTLDTLHELLPTLNFSTEITDLITVSGVIERIDEETACAWPTCFFCGSGNVDVGHSGTKCGSCQQVGQCSGMGYSLWLWLRNGLDMLSKVKLYQKTIEKLLSTAEGMPDEGYDVNTVIGRSLGPLICIVKQVKRNTDPNQVVILMELPY